MTEEKQYWTVEELESLTDTVQETEIEYQEKVIKISWCELTESEEPKALAVDENLSEEERNQAYLELARERVAAMMIKGQEKKPDESVLPVSVFEKLPTTLKFLVSNKVLGISDPNEQ
tara:strand:- start:616 stop:969 length:354 start_codon:yes stop_codon:yes gene_type:complete